MTETSRLCLLLALSLAPAAGCRGPGTAPARLPEGGGSEGPRAPVKEAADSLSLEAARKAHRRAELRRHLRFLEAADPGHLLRATAALVPQEEIDRGAVQPGALQEVGRLLFEHEYGFADGLGSGPSRAALPRSPFRRVHAGRSGGPETTTCGSCHWRGGLAGAGGLPDASFLYGDGDRTDSADGRNAPALMGVGVVQALAEEMSSELQASRARLEEEARRSGRPLDVELVAKGIRFGVLRAGADGTVDTSGVEGVDGDLVLRPFGWKGTFATLREFVAESLQVHFGIQSEDLLARHRRRPDHDLVGAGPDPEDPDGDGVRRELTSGQLTALAGFLAMLELPVALPPETVDGLGPAAPGLRAPTATGFAERWARGRRLFDEVRCAGCHVPMLVLKDPVFRTRSEATGGTVEIDLTRHGDHPRLAYDPQVGGHPVWLFSDLKRHDLGEANAARHADHGVAPRVYLTRRLWGLASSSPFMYDGSAPSIDDAIAAHGGEASAARSAFSALNPEDQAALRVFLLSLRRARRLEVP